MAQPLRSIRQDTSANNPFDEDLRAEFYRSRASHSSPVTYVPAVKLPLNAVILPLTLFRRFVKERSWLKVGSLKCGAFKFFERRGIRRGQASFRRDRNTTHKNTCAFLHEFRWIFYKYRACTLIRNYFNLRIITIR